MCRERCPFVYIRVTENLWMDIRFVQREIAMKVRISLPSNSPASSILTHAAACAVLPPPPRSASVASHDQCARSDACASLPAFRCCSPRTVQVLETPVTFHGLQQAFVKGLRESPHFEHNMDIVRVLLGSSKVFTRAWKLLTLIQYRCHIGGPGFFILECEAARRLLGGWLLSGVDGAEQRARTAGHCRADACARCARVQRRVARHADSDASNRTGRYSGAHAAWLWRSCVIEYWRRNAGTNNHL